MTALLDSTATELDLFTGPEPVAFDASIASDGLTIDTTFGPVDLIAVNHALEGRPVTLCLAERRYLSALRAAGVGKAV